MSDLQRRYSSDHGHAVDAIGSAPSPGKLPATARLAARPQTHIVFRVESPDAARELAGAMGLRDDSGAATAPDIQRAADTARAGAYDPLSAFGVHLLAHEVGATAGGAPVQLARDGHTGLDDAEVRASAAHGLSAPGEALPHLDAIQRAFGPHDVSGVTAHVGGAAREASRALGAHAYATGDHVAFAETPSLFLAAHEAAHVVQQRGGVQLSSAVGRAGDGYEQQADAVAARVVAGENAIDLLGPVAGSGGSTAVQRKDTPKTAAEAKQAGPLPRLRGLEALVGESFKVPWPEGDDIAWDDGVVVPIKVVGTGRDRVQVFRALQKGVTTVSLLGASGDEKTRYSVTVYAGGFEAVTSTGKPLSSSALNVIDADADHEVEVRFKTQRPLDKELVTAWSEELQEQGHARAFTVSTWRWDGNDVYWTVDCERPGTTVAAFHVLLEGQPFADERYRIERRVNGTEAKQLFHRARALADDLGLHISGWALESGINYSAAFARVKTAIDSDKEAEAFINDAAVSVAGVVCSGILGGALKQKDFKWMKGFLDGFCSEITGNGAGAGTEIAVGIAGKYAREAAAEKVEPLDHFLKLQHFGTATRQCLGDMLGAMQDQLEKHPGAVGDPLVRLDKAIAAQGFPWVAPSADLFERQAWKTWLDAGNSLEHWSGRDRVAVMARLDALSIAYDLSAVHAGPRPTGAETEAMGFGKSDAQIAEEARDRSDAKASDKARADARAHYEKTGRFPTIDASDDGVQK